MMQASEGVGATTGAQPSKTGGEQAKARRSRRGYFLPGVIALAVLLGIGTAFGAGDLDHQAPRVLSGVEVASQVELGLQAEVGGANLPYVTCPVSEPVIAGLTFACLEHPHNGPVRPISVTEIDAHGQLRFGLPGS